MTKYKISWRDKIVKVEVERETEHCVFTKEPNGKIEKHLKKSSYSNYFDSWKEAHDFMLTKAEKLIAKRREEGKRAIEYFDKVRDMINEEEKQNDQHTYYQKI